MQGDGIPPNAFLVQLVAADPSERTLVLAVGNADGAWMILRPSCNTARNSGALAALPWVKPLDADRCLIRRAGLTDERLFQTLTAAISEDNTTALWPLE